jgi:hypothetical protein
MQPEVSSRQVLTDHISIILVMKSVTHVQDEGMNDLAKNPHLHFDTFDGPELIQISLIHSFHGK